ncbi:ATP-dependent endonuclease [Phycicoccus sp. Soil803]|uniref:ATP-dependent nuclease n=1 Tax=Phycicoccus sp. Soil803 TaxID=1736415 RepID=UPI0009E94CA8|nr:AAA family ATPase [Phycicoccus sp. Soil803]
MTQSLALKSLRLVNYKGFENHSISLRRTNVLVGANNAGKSTALGAMRLLASMLPQARRINPNGSGEVEGRATRGWPITAAAIEASAFSDENIRHDFRLDETRIEAVTSTGVRILVSWASMLDYDEEDGQAVGTFFVFPPDGGKLIQPRAAARDLVPNIAVVPTLTPLDDREAYVSDETWRRHRTSKRSSRYFRNALYRLDPQQWIEFTSYVYERTPELTNLTLRRAMGTVEDDFDLFFEEEGTRREREIAWAGDGVQIWLQALYHLWQQRGAPVVILDEPDVFLHPDLQRRLARTIFAGNQQTILATHSVEMLAEAEPGSAVWIDRSRRTAERPKGDGSLALMGRRLGSGYELGVGRALRSRVALFVEGDDAPVLAQLARRAGRTSVASSDGYATIPLGGFSRNSVAGAFAETMGALGSQVRTYVILDGDLRCDHVRRAEITALENAGARVHLWRRRELENYLLVPSAIAKVSGVSIQDARELLGQTLEQLGDEALLALQTTRIEEKGARGNPAAALAPKSVLSAAGQEFEQQWATTEGRLSLVDAKLAIRSMNTALQQRQARTINVHSLAKSMPAADVPAEVLSVIDALEELISGR